MALRLAYLTVGLVMGLLVGIILTTKSPVVKEAVTKAVAESQKSALTDADLRAPAQIRAGHDQPRKLFIDETLLSVPLNWSWNYLPQADEPAYGMSNWLYYGSVEGGDETFMLGYITPGKLGLRSKGVRSEIADKGVFRRKKIKLKFFGDDRHLKIPEGNAALATFSYRQDGLHKICVAFQLITEQRDRQYEGFLCAKLGDVPNDAHLACLLNSIRIYNNAYWIEPDSDKATRKRCQIKPRRNMMDVSVVAGQDAGSDP